MRPSVATWPRPGVAFARRAGQAVLQLTEKRGISKQNVTLPILRLYDTLFAYCHDMRRIPAAEMCRVAMRGPGGLLG